MIASWNCLPSPPGYRPGFRWVAVAPIAMSSLPDAPKTDQENDQPANSSVGVNSPQSWSSNRLTISDASESDTALSAEIERLLGNDPGEDIDGNEAEDDELSAEFEADLKAFIGELDEELIGANRARGEPLWVGFDGEWVENRGTQTNTILSIQLYVPAQLAISKQPDKRVDAERLSRIVYASGPTKEGRPSLQGALRQLIEQALSKQLIAEALR